MLLSDLLFDDDDEDWLLVDVDDDEDELGFGGAKNGEANLDNVDWSEVEVDEVAPLPLIFILPVLPLFAPPLPPPSLILNSLLLLLLLLFNWLKSILLLFELAKLKLAFDCLVSIIYFLNKIFFEFFLELLMAGLNYY